LRWGRKNDNLSTDTTLCSLSEIRTPVTQLLRLLKRSVLPSLAVIALVVPASASTTLSFGAPSAYGSYLAGQQALRDLSTGEASRYLHEATAAEWDNATVVQRAFLAYLANGDIDRAVGIANHVLDLSPDFGLANLAIAAAELKDRRYHAAERDLNGVTSADFAGITAAILRGWAFIGDGRRTDAYAALDRMAKGGLEDFMVFHRALMADVSGDSATALALASQTYQANPVGPRNVEIYARVLGNAGRFDDALAVIDKYNAQGLGDPILDVVEKALRAHQRPGLFATSVQSGAAEAFHGIAVALARDGNTDLAIGVLQLGLYLDPHNDIISLLIGQLLDNAKQNAAANAYYANIPASSPMHLTAQVRIAQNYDSMGNRPEALKRLNEIVGTNPTDLDALTVLAELLRADKQYDRAADIYSQAIAIDKGAHIGDWVLYYQRGIAYERGNKWDKAQPDFLKALALNPDQPQVLNYLGYTWVDKGENLTQALGMIQKAVKATPTDGYIVDSLGWAFYRLGRFSDAVKTLEQAVQLKPNDPQINDHLGDAYWKAGRQLEAHFQWNVAASLDADGLLKTELAKKQANGLDATTASATPATTTQ
jgi:tetratricopeptide (TPR) repeat protein